MEIGSAGNDPGVALLATAGLDAEGNTLALFRRFVNSPPSWSMLARRYEAGAWGTTEELHSGSQPSSPSLVVSGDGTAFATWLVGSSPPRVMHFVPGAGWTDSSGPWTTRPRIAMDDSGNAVAAWVDGGSVVASHFDGTAWQAAQSLATGTSTFGLTVASNATGDAAVAWRDAAGIMLVRHVTGSGWAAPEAVTAALANPRIGVDANANVMVLWESTALMSRRFELCAGWGPEQTVSEPSARESQAAFNAAGQVLTVWMSADGFLRGAAYDPAGAAWAAPVAVTDEFNPPGELGAGGDDLGVGLDACGAGHLVFRRNGALANLWAARYTPSAGFAAPAELENLPSASYYPSLVTAPSGISVIVWEYGPGFPTYSLRFE